MLIKRVLGFIFLLIISNGSFAVERTIAVVVKGQGIGFFDAVNKGALEAATQVGDTKILYTGPKSGAAEAQLEIVMSLIQQKVDAIVISAIDADTLVPVLRYAMRKGIKVISFDSAVAENGRQVHLSPSNSELIGQACIEMADEAAKIKGGNADVAILSAASTSTNQNIWIDEMKRALKKYPNLELKKIVYGDDDAQKSYRETQKLLESTPGISVIISPTAVGIEAAARYVTDKNLIGKVQVTGLGLPSMLAPYVNNQAVNSFAIWNPIDLGYSATMIAIELIDNRVTTSDKFSRIDKKYKNINMGRMGSTVLDDTGVAIMAPPMKYDSTNIEEYKTVF
jgi:rhamnose transport system substrate-binding protein